MAWIEAHQELRDHPKTKRAARMLGISRPQMIGHLVCLWWWCLDYAEDGEIGGFDREDIAEAAAWEGDADLFIDALLTCGIAGKPGFLDATNGLTVNDWQEYGGKYAIKRNQSRERQREYRGRHERGSGAPTPSPSRDNSVTPQTADDTTARDKRVSNALLTRDKRVSNAAREDKIRGDKKREEKNPESAQTPSAIADPVATPPVPVSLTGWTERLRDSSNRQAVLVLMFETLYPGAVDVPSFAYIGRVANKVGGAGRLAELLWQNAAKPPSGDVLAYIQAQVQANKPSTNGARPQGHNLRELLGLDKED